MEKYEMKYCEKHTSWYTKFCPNCKAEKKPYLRHKCEMNPEDKREIKRFEKFGWMKHE